MLLSNALTLHYGRNFSMSKCHSNFLQKMYKCSNILSYCYCSHFTLPISHKRLMLQWIYHGQKMFLCVTKACFILLRQCWELGAAVCVWLHNCADLLQLMLKFKSIVNVYSVYVGVGLEPRAFIAQTWATAERLWRAWRKKAKKESRKFIIWSFCLWVFSPIGRGEISSYQALSQTRLKRTKKEHMVFLKAYTVFHIFCAVPIDGKW